MPRIFYYEKRNFTVFSSGRFQLRSWMFVYLGLLAAIVLAGRPEDDAGANDLERVATPTLSVRSPLLRHDI